MRWLDRETVRVWFLLGTLLVATLASSCSNSMDDATINAERLCPLSVDAFAKQDFGDLLSELERQVGMSRNKMRITKEGVFVPMKERFVEEQGYFIAKPGVDMSVKGTDPAFELIKGCIYHYQIKG